ncbi:MAG: hypothetical protein IJU98_03435 [Synergistaceae bacterium]|nr:hypothetical protein [Synergistaceae bacterium]
MAIMPILLFFAFGLFGFGLLQWARSGESMWEMRKIRRKMREGKQDWREVEKEEAELKRLEKRADGMLRTSVRVVGFVTLFAWAIAGVTFVLDALGVRWARSITSRASQYWKASTPNPFEHHSSRNEILHGMSSNMSK